MAPSKAPSMRMKGHGLNTMHYKLLVQRVQDMSHEAEMERTEVRMIRWMCRVSLRERQPSTELRRCLGTEANGDVMIRCRLRWHAHVKRKDDADYVKAYTY